jgi:hypothetical protein
LTEFLLARIAEDEAAANAAHRESMRGHAGPGFARSRVAWAAQAEEVRGHALIERFSPVRVLAECEAKRRIVELHESLVGDPYGEIKDRVVYWCALCDQDRDYIGIPHEEDGCETLRALGAIYADHPDYREEWKP